MKIYTEITFTFDEKQDKYVEISSTSMEYNGEIALCGHDDSDNRQEFDADLMKHAVGTLDLLQDKYRKSANPESSFFAKEIDRVSGNTEQMRTEAQEKFALQGQQAQENYELAQNKGNISYNQMIAKSSKDIKRVTQESQRQAQEGRQSVGEASFGAMQQMGASGMAGVGGRARKTLASQRQTAQAKMVAGVTAERENIKDALSNAEQQKNITLTEEASSLNQAKATGALQLEQAQSELDRNLQEKTASLLQEQSNSLDKIRMEAAQIVSSTVTSFTDADSNWGSSGGSDNYNPWYKPFDDIDTEFEGGE